MSLIYFIKYNKQGIFDSSFGFHFGFHTQRPKSWKSPQEPLSNTHRQLSAFPSVFLPSSYLMNQFTFMRRIQPPGLHLKNYSYLPATGNESYVSWTCPRRAEITAPEYSE